MRAAAKPANEAPTMMTEAGGGSDADDEEVETAPPMVVVRLVFCVPTILFLYIMVRVRVR